MSDPAVITGGDSASPRFTLAGMFLFIAVFACLCGGLVCVRDATRRFHGPEPGIVTNPAELPANWPTFEAGARRANAPLSNVEFYRIRKDWDEAYAIRLEYTPEALAFLVNETRSSPVTPPSHFIQDFWDAVPVIWTTPVATTSADYYVSAGLIAGNDGGRFVLMHDKVAQKIYIWYYFMF